MRAFFRGKKEEKEKEKAKAKEKEKEKVAQPQPSPDPRPSPAAKPATSPTPTTSSAASRPNPIVGFKHPYHEHPLVELGARSGYDCFGANQPGGCDFLPRGKNLHRHGIPAYKCNQCTYALCRFCVDKHVPNVPAHSQVRTLPPRPKPASANDTCPQDFFALAIQEEYDTLLRLAQENNFHTHLGLDLGDGNITGEQQANAEKKLREYMAAFLRQKKTEIDGIKQEDVTKFNENIMRHPTTLNIYLLLLKLRTFYPKIPTAQLKNLCQLERKAREGLAELRQHDDEQLSCKIPALIKELRALEGVVLRTILRIDPLNPFGEEEEGDNAVPDILTLLKMLFAKQLLETDSSE